jgi:SM-20-related protein
MRVKFKLAAGLDREQLRARFLKDNYLHIPGILQEVCAHKIHATLMEKTPWSLCFNDRGKHMDVALENLSAMTADQGRRLQLAILEQAKTSFQYCYQNYPIYDAYGAGRNPGHLLHRFYEWLNTDEFLSFARFITNFSEISFADAQATRFSAGHFLKCHNDAQAGKNRRVAYIFNFTDHWESDWGGYLQLLDKTQHVRRGIKPAFNSLNLLAVPQDHNVSFVTPFAQGVRLAVTGWLRYGTAN